MTLAGDSILVTPGSGATVATHTVSSKEHQVVMLANEAGHLYGSIPTWCVYTGNQANVAAARTTHVDLFNASGSGQIIEVVGLFIIPTLAAVTGVGLTWEIIRTSAAGTGGSTITPQPYDSSNTALHANVTARKSPTGAATTSITWAVVNSSSEETIPYASLASQLNHVPTHFHEGLQGFYLREGQGIKVDQTTSSNVGSTNIMIVFTVE
jgi:hypothetical protein